MNSTAISWTDYTWGVFSGCKKVSPECRHCYAETFSERHRGGAAFPHGFDLTVRPHKLDEPRKLLKSKGPSLIFCESMSDIGLDDDELTPAEIDRLTATGYTGMDHVRDAFFEAVCATPEHRYQLLTKRPKTLRRYFESRGRKVPACVWLGVTIGHPSSLHRLDDLRAFRDLGARVLFVSAEPLLGDLVGAGMQLHGVDWIIVGGESGGHAIIGAQRDRFLVRRSRVDEGGRAGGVRWRPREDALYWVGRLQREAIEAGCSFFFKQWGGSTPESGGRLLQGETCDGMPDHVAGAMPERRADIGAATAALARKRLPVVSA